VLIGGPKKQIPNVTDQTQIIKLIDCLKNIYKKNDLLLSVPTLTIASSEGTPEINAFTYTLAISDLSTLIEITSDSLV